mmetsp:Transcript_7026/g.10242  ORF Transcript_7026/g.10242 Transcript_7026/m.10242 type:complete len:80 (-) Transcript_7026:2435-2674(-)
MKAPRSVGDIEGKSLMEGSSEGWDDGVIVGIALPDGRNEGSLLVDGVYEGSEDGTKEGVMLSEGTNVGPIEGLLLSDGS